MKSHPEELENLQEKWELIHNLLESYEYDLQYNTAHKKSLTNIYFEENELQVLIKEIENSPFYNLQYNFNRSNAEEWLKSDTVVYWKVRNHLEEEKITGYWKKGDAYTYNFYNPNFSDIPNSALLFNEAFEIEVTLNTKSKKLIYQYYKL
jgi:hypothetical protein